MFFTIVIGKLVYYFLENTNVFTQQNTSESPWSQLLADYNARCPGMDTFYVNCPDQTLPTFLLSKVLNITAFSGYVLLGGNIRYFALSI